MEPEVLPDGDHDLAFAQRVTEQVNAVKKYIVPFVLLFLLSKLDFIVFT